MDTTSLGNAFVGPIPYSPPKWAWAESIPGRCCQPRFHYDCVVYYGVLKVDYYIIGSRHAYES